MSKSWTKDQQNAIDVMDKNILVSAAAGSGKTAVLVARIVKSLLSRKRSIDRLVVVTFTKAAAAEMKDRIRRELEKELKKDPENLYLYNQLSLLGDANISTIDSFCQRLLRTGFEEAGIEPDFRVADNGETALLEADVFNKIIEDFYLKKGEDFYDFASAFGGKKNDGDIEDLVLQLYTNAINNPWPFEWLEEILKPVKDFNAANPEDNPVLNSYLGFFKLRLAGFRNRYENIISFLNADTGLEKYLECAVPERDMFNSLSECTDFKKLGSMALSMEWKRLPSVKDEDCDTSVKAGFQKLRQNAKDLLKDILKMTGRLGDEKGFRTSELDYINKVLCLLTEMTKEFIKAVDKEKRERNIVSFNDLEHLVLNLLVKRENGVSTPTPMALELKDYYQEIMTDEYQDSNMLQEEILNAVSDGSNRYMVGDVKQSIYGFRKARPDIFTDKYMLYETFSNDEKTDNKDTKILLQKNFRSRDIILDAVNLVFRKAMKRECGGIDYTAEHELTPGLDYPKADASQNIFNEAAGKVNVEYIYRDDDERRDNTELEAELVAMRINELIKNDTKVYDAETGSYRSLRFSDIAIVSRKKDIADICVEVLMRSGISVFAESNESYLETFELRPVVSMLKILDNPLDDIALASVMLSYFGGFSPQDIARLKMNGRYEFLYHNLRDYEKEDGLYDKKSEFLSYLEALRKKAVNGSVYDMIWEIIYETGYYNYLCTTPSHEGRLANIALLLNHAASFAGTSFNGLFQFLRYLERLKKAELGLGEVSVLGEYDDVVRVMTIHKSKGLEFPVVFVLGMTKEFNLTDDGDKLVIKDGLGAAVSVIDTKKRLKRISIFKNAILSRLRLDEIGEEIRLLYVAMTRAREKLYMVGSGSRDSADAYIKTDSGAGFDMESFLSLKSFFEICMPAAADPVNAKYFDIISTLSSTLKPLSNPDSKPDKKEKTRSDKIMKKAKFVKKKYDFEDEIDKKPKVTVTELKRMSMESEEEAAADNRIFNISGDAGFSEIGNAYHKVLECLDLSDTDTDEQISLQINGMLSRGLLTKEGAEAVKINDIRTFMDSPTGRAAKDAFVRGSLVREQEFMMGIEQDDMTDYLLVQGVIDMYMEEEDGLVLVDHKTDRVSPKGGAKKLENRYRQQLYYYKKALEQATGKTVKKCLIYSFSLGKEIEVNV